jgi:hypothetical protein
MEDSTAGVWTGAGVWSSAPVRRPMIAVGMVATTIRAMNDDWTLYVSPEVGRASYGGDIAFALCLDHDGVRKVGDVAFFADVDTSIFLAAADGR